MKRPPLSSSLPTDPTGKPPSAIPRLPRSFSLNTPAFTRSTRRELIGLSVRASTKNQWSQIYDYMRFSRLRDQLNSPNTPAIQVRWRNAGFAGSRVGKGLLKMEVTANSLLLLSTHWLELVDHAHRYGSNLLVYHAHWMELPTRQSFFGWLDYGEGKELSLDECPRSKLESVYFPGAVSVAV